MFDFFEFSNEMLCVADRRGYFTRVNPAWTKILGWSAEELTSRPFIDFVHPEDIEATIREARLLLSGTHETILFENRYRTPDGSYRWLSWHVKFAPEFEELVATARDVTDQKLQAQALRESEDRFRHLAMHAPVGIAQSDAEGRTFFVNPKWCEISGAAPEESMGYGWQALLHPDDHRRLIEKWQADMAVGRSHSSSVFRFVRKDGTIRWASSTASLIHDEDGNAIGQIGVTQDITERKEAEQRFRGIYEQSPIGIALIDSQSGRFLQINPRYEQIIGRTEAEMVKLTFQEITHPDDLAEDLGNMQSMREGTIRRFQMEKRLLRGDGSFMWANLTVVPMWQVEESVSYHLAMIEDITARKAAEDAHRETEERFLAFMNHLPATAWAKDEEGRFVYVNNCTSVKCF